MILLIVGYYSLNHNKTIKDEKPYSISQKEPEKDDKSNIIEIDFDEHIRSESPNVIKVNVKESIINNLVYPKYNRYTVGVLVPESNVLTDTGWVYDNIEAKNMKRIDQMFSAQLAISQDEYKDSILNDHGVIVYPEAVIRKNFVSIFGPSVKYSKGDVTKYYRFFVHNDETKYDSQDNCGMISQYVDKTKNYYGYTDCGGDYTNNVRSKEVITKVVGINNTIEVDVDFIYYIISDKYEFFNKYPKLDPEREIISKSLLSSDDFLQGFNDLVNNGQIGKYRYIFKKQADGKYYFTQGKLLG